MFYAISVFFTIWLILKLSNRAMGLKKAPRKPSLSYKERVKLRRMSRFVTEGDTRLCMADFHKERL